MPTQPSQSRPKDDQNILLILSQGIDYVYLVYVVYVYVYLDYVYIVNGQGHQWRYISKKAAVELKGAVFVKYPLHRHWLSESAAHAPSCLFLPQPDRQTETASLRLTFSRCGLSYCTVRGAVVLLRFSVFPCVLPTFGVFSVITTYSVVINT